MKKTNPKFICQCNQIPRDVIEAAIVRGCKSVQKVAIATTAGAGQCGGTCQPEIQKIIDEMLKSDPAKSQAPERDFNKKEPK